MFSKKFKYLLWKIIAIEYNLNVPVEDFVLFFNGVAAHKANSATNANERMIWREVNKNSKKQNWSWSSDIQSLQRLFNTKLEDDFSARWLTLLAYS